MKKGRQILSVRNNSTPKNTGTLLCTFLNSSLIPLLFILILFLQVYACGSPGGGGGGGDGEEDEISFAAPIKNAFNISNVFLAAFQCFVDINNDGDLDAFIGEFEGNLIYFENTGDAGAPAFGAASTNPFGLADVGDYAAPCFVDIDDDGDLDAFVGEANGNIIYFENTGDAGAPAFGAASTNPFGLADVGDYAAPCFVDIDDDGDLDAFVGNEDGNIIYFENTGDAGAPAFGAASTNPFGLADVGDYAAPCFVDIDDDGDLDAFVGEANGNIIYFENNGSVDSPSFAAPVTNPFSLSDVGDYSIPEFVDIDDDGDLDAFIGEDFGDTYYFENILY